MALPVGIHPLQRPGRQLFPGSSTRQGTGGKITNTKIGTYQRDINYLPAFWQGPQKERCHMKYIVVIGDGMADYPLPQLGGKTPLQAAAKPALDELAGRGIMGMARTIPEGMPAGSDTANLAVMGYDPRRYHSGRSPFEAAGLGVALQPGYFISLQPGYPFCRRTLR